MQLLEVIVNKVISVAIPSLFSISFRCFTVALTFVLGHIPIDDSASICATEGVLAGLAMHLEDRHLCRHPEEVLLWLDRLKVKAAG